MDRPRHHEPRPEPASNNNLSGRGGRIRHSPAIKAAQVELLYQQAPASLFATVVNALLLAFGLWNSLSTLAVALWVAAVIGLSGARYQLLRQYLACDRSPLDTLRWQRRFVAGVALNGLLWGIAGVAFFLPESHPHQALLAFVLAGMSAGAVATLSPLRGASHIFLLPALAPYTLRLLGDGDAIHSLMGAMVILFILMMWVISGRLHANVAESLSLRFENLDLLEDQRRARDRQDVAHRKLAAVIEAKVRAQQALREAYTDLERRVAERTQELAKFSERLAMEKERFRTTLASIGDGVITADEDDRVTYLNPAAEQFTGWGNSEAVGVPLTRVFRVACEPIPSKELEADRTWTIDPADGRSSGNLVLSDRYGNERNIHHTAAPICNRLSQTVGTVLTFRDISEERKLAHRLSYQATHDPLTGLVNRREFERRLDRVLSSSRHGSPHALIFMDLDQFKIVNDTCGHIAGDELLRQISVLMRTRIRTRDTFARLGGDEFGVLLEHCPRAEAISVAHTLRELVQDFRFGWQDKSFIIGVSIGLVDLADVSESSASILRAADSACYAAKDRGRNRVYVYQPDDHAVARRLVETQWMPRIQQALNEGRMRLYLQPIVPIGRGRPRHQFGEILVRLVDEQGRVVLPGAFLPAAERYGQMNAIDRWVVSETFNALKTLGAAQRQRVLAINLSGQSLSNEDFLDFVIDRIRSSQIITASLCFEITETAAISDLRSALTFITNLRELGCRFSLDDFGSGLSSFGYLKTLPIDYLKIDGRFVKEIVTDRVDAAMVEAIQRLANVMGLETIAEWVENADTLAKLTAMHIDYAQGFHVAPPRPM